MDLICLQKRHKDNLLFIANWNYNAIVTKDYTYIFSNLPNKMFRNEVRENKTYHRVKGHNIDGKIILDVMNNNRRFLQ